MSDSLDLGCFSVSLAVQDLERSVAFYEALGFHELGGGEGYLILGNGPTKIGLFEKMFEQNILTFNPGLAQEWDEDAAPPAAEGPDGATTMPGQLEDFTDIRVIEQRLLDAGVELTRRTETPEGADHLLLVDPDGNQIMIDQFF